MSIQVSPVTRAPSSASLFISPQNKPQQPTETNFFYLSAAAAKPTLSHIQPQICTQLQPPLPLRYISHSHHQPQLAIPTVGHTQPQQLKARMSNNSITVLQIYVLFNIICIDFIICQILITSLILRFCQWIYFCALNNNNLGLRIEIFLLVEKSDFCL